MVSLRVCKATLAVVCREDCTGSKSGMGGGQLEANAISKQER